MAKKKKHTLLKVVGTTAVVGGASYMAAGYYIFRNLFDMKNSNLNTKEKAVADEEKREWLNHSIKDDEFIDSYDGIKLHGLRISNHEDSHKWIILSHGYNAYSQDMLDYMFESYQKGYNALAIDQRGCGMSDGTYSGLGWNEHYDLISWINYLITIDPEAEICLLGLNYGGAAVLYALGEFLPTNVKCAIEDGSFSDAKEFVSHATQRYLKVDGSFLIPSINLYVKNFLKYSLTEVSMKRALKQSSIPTLFIHGMEDELIPASHVFDNYYACESEKELFTIDGAKGNETKTSEGYFEAIFNFVGQYM
ncbi:MAG: alpha/beta hydrolase [Solobacterium sp.]|nr:alpha/beta hydrolase [Solobacterium sp.]